jgi:uncharacterized phage protein gp47/JayE
MASPTGPVITVTGISAPTYAQILAYYVAAAQSIYGADIYLGNDSALYQLLAVFAQATSDANSAAIAVYNSFSPATGQGVGLSSNVKINGLARLVPSFSTVPLTVGGIANTPISSGQAVDANKNVWALPASVTIPSNGVLQTTGTCTVAGAITAAPGTVTTINTPVYGWQTVTNASAASPGAPVETDAALRVRQSVSVSLPSVTIFEGIVAAIENLPGVTRVTGYENNTSTTNGDGIPAHTLYFVVEGGVESAIIEAIFAKITPGIPTMGSISQIVTDTNGSQRLIRYDVPVDATISVVITLAPLSGWTSATAVLIQGAVAAFLNVLAIGGNISFFGLIPVAQLLVNPLDTAQPSANVSFAGTFEITAMTLQKNSGSVVSSDIQLNYNEAAVCAPANVTVTVS